jgi:hypothetical protein
MTPERPSLERRVLSILGATPPRVPVLLGGCGTGRTSVLLRAREALGPRDCQYVDIERGATTPERFLDRLRATSPFALPDAAAAPERTARQAYDAALAIFERARTDRGEPATFLLDEMLELRTFESFPGLRSALRDLVDVVAGSPNRFVLSARYMHRAHRLLRDASGRFEVIHVPPLSTAEVRAGLPPSAEHRLEEEQDELARAIQVLADGRPVYVRALMETMALMERHGGSDPVSVLHGLLAPGGSLDTTCRFTYELRLHRARGYGALKAILDILALEEPLTLTEIALRLRRTPGSTKDYLSWLENVDLITARQKRYSYADPLLRLWVRLHGQAAPPTPDELAREVHAYAMARLPAAEPAMAGMAARPRTDTPGSEEDRRNWGIIEID